MKAGKEREREREREKTSKVEIGSKRKRWIEWADGYDQRSENGQRLTTNLCKKSKQSQPKLQ